MRERELRFETDQAKSDGERFDGELRPGSIVISRDTGRLQQLPSSIINYSKYSSIRQVCWRWLGLGFGCVEVRHPRSRGFACVSRYSPTNPGECASPAVRPIFGSARDYRAAYREFRKQGRPCRVSAMRRREPERHTVQLKSRDKRNYGLEIRRKSCYDPSLTRFSPAAESWGTSR